MSIFGSAQLSTDEPAQTPEDTSPGQFRQGLRSGFYGAGSQLQSAAGGAAEALGFDEFAGNRFDDARALKAKAEANAPRVSSYKDVHDLRSGFDYVTGLVGQSVPQSGAALVGGIAGGLVGGPGGAAVGAATALTPFNTGDVVQRQQADPEVASLPADERFARALGTGAASSAVESIVPGAIAARIAAPVARQTVTQALRKGLRELPKTMAEESATEVAGEATRQFGTNPDRPFDREALVEAGVGGAAAGGPLHVAGVAGDVAHAASSTPTNVLSGVRDMVQRVGQKTGEAAADAGYPLDSPLTSLGAASKDTGRAFWDAVKRGADFIDQRAGDTVESVAARMPGMDAERAAKVREAYEDIRTNAPDAIKAMVANVGDLTDRTQQATVGAARDAWANTQRFKDRVKNWRDGFDGETVDGEAREVPERAAIGGPKKSAENEGLRRAIAESILPAIQQHMPGVLADNDSINDAADGIRLMIDRIATPGRVLTEREIEGLTKTFGDAAEPIMAAAYRAVFKDSGTASEAFFGALNQIAEAREGHNSFVEVLKKNAGTKMTDSELSDLAWEMTKWAKDFHQGSRVKGAAENKVSQARTYRDRKIMENLRAIFGDKTEGVLEALRAHAGNDEENALSHEEAFDLDERGGATLSERIQHPAHQAVLYGTGDKQDQLVLAPKFQKDPEKNQVTAALERAKADHPGKDVKFLSADELGDHPSVNALRGRLTLDLDGDEAAVNAEMKKYGMVVAEGERDGLTLTRRDVSSLKLVQKDGDTYSHPAALRVERADGKTDVLDAIRLTKKMAQQIDKVAGESDVARASRAFKEGLAALAIQYGKPVEPAGDTAIAILGMKGGKPVYLQWKDAQNIDQRTDGDRSRDDAMRQLEDLRAQYQVAKKAGNKEEMLRLAKEGKKLTDAIGEDTASSLMAGADIDYEGFAEQEADPFGEVHEALKGSDSGRGINVNSDGSPRNPEAGPKQGEKRGEKARDSYPLLREKLEGLLAAGTAPQIAVATRGLEILDNSTKLSPGGQKALKSIAGTKKDRKFSEVAGVINELHAQLFGKEPAAKSEAPKPAAKPEAKNDSADIDRAFATESYPEFKTNEEAQAFMVRAAKRFVELKKEDERIGRDDNHPTGELPEPQRTTFMNLYALFDRQSHADLSSFFPDFGTNEITDDDVRAAIAKAVPEVAAKGPKGGKKFSLMATRVHEELGRPGFAATHDSPIKHEGRFNWREHSGKGEGNASFGAGTYLSTSEGVHRSYKQQFTAQVAEAGPTINGKSEGFSKAEAALKRVVENEPTLKASAQRARAKSALQSTIRSDVAWAADHYAALTGDNSAAEAIDEGQGYDKLRAVLRDKIEANEENMLRQDRLDDAYKYIEDALDALDNEKTLFKEIDTAVINEGTKAPTYEVSVDIGQDQLLNWDKPLTDQHPKVAEAMQRLADKYDITLTGALEWEKEGNDWSASFGADSEALIAMRDGGFNLYVDGDFIGQYRGLDEAKSVAQSMTGDGKVLYNALADKLGSQRAASDALQEVGILGHRYAANAGRNDTHPNYVIYDDSKITTNYVHFSRQGTNQSRTASAAQEAAVRNYIDNVLGPRIRVEFANLLHAGEFEAATASTPNIDGIIRVSVHALSPLSVGFHESIHAFIKLLNKQGNSRIANTLMDVSMSEHVQRQLKDLLKNEPDALAQLSDPEEAAAYLYQFWMRGKITQLAPVARTWFQKIKEFIEKVLGMWSKERRALEVMEYFKRGDFRQGQNDPNAVAHALWDSGRNELIEKARKYSEPLMALGDRLLAPAGNRMRESGIPAFRKIADLVKRELVQEGSDPGYLPAARYKYSLYMNKLATKLQTFDKSELDEALAAMQDPTLKSNASPPALAIIDLVQGQQGILPEMYRYAKRAGVDVSRFQPRPDYFPRLYDIDYIARNEAAFVKVLERHQIPDAVALTRRIIANNGNEFTAEVNNPGNQHFKERKLAAVPDAELARFMVKDPFRILGGYIMQTTRQAEWARRFGQNGERIGAMLAEAREQGATKEQLAMADDFVKAVNGTLGDSISPTARRVMGHMVVYQNLRLLPLAIFSNLVDPIGIMVRGGKLADAFNAYKRGVTEIRNTFRKTYTADADVRLAEQMGTIDNAVLAHEMSSLYTQGMVGEKARKINDWFFRFNLTEGMQRAMRVSATQAAIRFLELHADGTATPHSKRWLAELGLEPGDITGPIDASAHPKIKAAINRWVDGAVLRPDAADRTIWMSDPHFMLISHLKQFVFAFQETILKRVAHEYRHGNYAPAMALATYVPVMIAADMVKHLIQGGGELPEWKRDWGVSDYVGAGIERAGLLGTRQFGLDMMQDLHRGEVWMGSLTGPAVDQAFEGLSVLGGRVDGRQWTLDALPAHAVYEGAVK